MKCAQCMELSLKIKFTIQNEVKHKFNLCFTSFPQMKKTRTDSIPKIQVSKVFL